MQELVQKGGICSMDGGDDRDIACALGYLYQVNLFLLVLYGFNCIALLTNGPTHIPTE